MALSLIDIQSCISLGRGVGGKARMGLFALLAPSFDQPPRRWKRWLCTAMPSLFIEPAQLNGLKLLIDPTDWSQTVIFEEVFLRNGYDLNRIEFVPQKILDCGAHVGIFSLLAKSKFPDTLVVAFEPNPQNIQFIQRQIEENQVDIQLVEAAVSTSAGEMNFSWSNSHSGRLKDDSTTGGVRVKVVNLIEFVREARLSSVLLKMDVEGEEIEILPELVPILPPRSAIFFETHSGEEGWQTIADLFLVNGFRVEQINARGDYYDGFACR